MFVDVLIVSLTRHFHVLNAFYIDDFSSDLSPVICDEYAQKDVRIKVIHNVQNKGSSQSRKIGLEMAKGDYILFVDSDDWCESNMLEVLYDKLVSKDYDMVFCNFFTERQMKQVNVNIIDGLESDQILRLLLTKKLAFLWNKLVKKDLYIRSFFPSADYYDDFVISTQTVSYAKRIGYVEDALYHYCRNPNSICENKEGIDKRLLDLHINFQAVADFLRNKYGDKIIQFKDDFNQLVKAHIEKLGDETFSCYYL